MAEAATLETDDVRKMCILVVEDEVLIRLVISEELRQAGYCVVEASSGDEALNLLATDLHPDLLITDVRMPGLVDGMALARAARVLRPGLAIAVSSGHVRGGSDLGDIVDAFLPKPYMPAQLIGMVERLLTQAR